jgi:hypothetical protein
MKLRCPFRKFTAVFLSLFACLSLLILGFNWLVNPFDYFDAPAVKRFNAVKTGLINQERFYKALQIERLKPKALVLGSSRVLIGINPDDVANLIGEPVYNGAFVGANFEEIYQFFELALHHQPQLKTVIVGIDFFAFNENRKETGQLSKEDFIQFPFSFKKWKNCLFTKLALKASLLTISGNLWEEPAPIFWPNGYYNLALEKEEKNPILQMGEVKYLQSILDSRYWYKDFRISEKRLALFDQMVQTCQEKNIDLFVFINPCKALYWEALHIRQMSPVIEHVKQRLCEIYHLWDFSGFNPLTLETWLGESYFDLSHYKPHIGKLLVESMIDKKAIPFGCLVNPRNFQETCRQQQEERAKWLQKKSSQVVELEKKLGTTPVF